MLKKLTNQSEVQKMKVDERTASISCSGECYVMCQYYYPELFNIEYELSYFAWEH